MKVTDERKLHSRVLSELVENILKQKGKKISKVLADDAYDSNSIFLFLAYMGVLPCIRVRIEEFKSERVKPILEDSVCPVTKR